MSHDVRFTHIDERPGGFVNAPGVKGRLGRHVGHDSRSLAYQVDPRDVQVVSKMWARHTPILDQGDVGSCTGNAAAGALGCDPLDVQSALDETEALKLYHEATTLDSDPGTYPPDDTGSTGLAVAKACQNDGLISGYTHAMSIQAMQAALMDGPVIVGVNWYDGFDNPDADGLVTITGSVRGGHEFVVRGIDVENQLFHADNSWGASWGKDGSFSFSIGDMKRLLSEEGDAVLFAPISGPAPTPVPQPGPIPPTPGPTPVVVVTDDDLAPVLEHIVGEKFHYVGHRNLAVLEGWLASRTDPATAHVVGFHDQTP